MPAVVRRLIIFPAGGGLILQPAHAHRSQQPSSTLHIDYKVHQITDIQPKSIDEVKGEVTLEAHGIIGFLKFASHSYLIAVTQRRQVAQIFGKPVYVVTDVAIIPLSSQSDATEAIRQARQQQDGTRGKTATSDTSDSECESIQSEEESPSDPDPGLVIPIERENAANVAQDVIRKQGNYGRFAGQWFSREGWKLERTRTLGLSTENINAKAAAGGRPFAPSRGRSGDTAAKCDDREGGSAAEAPMEGSGVQLLPKLLKTTKMILSAASFFFSYDVDLTRRLDKRYTSEPNSLLHEVADPLYFWNRHLAQPLIDSGHHAFVIPFLQGFVGQRVFSVAGPARKAPATVSKAVSSLEEILKAKDTSLTPTEEEDPSRPYLLTLISRRSVMRPGLRFLRRGIDDSGNTANTVETEQVLSSPQWSKSQRMSSFTQMRGSIPLYFSQSPYGFKPVPVLTQSSMTNEAAFAQHFQDLADRYGKVHAVALIDKHGGEAKIGEEYQKYVHQFNVQGNPAGSSLGFEWFDFHTECRGMKFENVSRLVSNLTDTLKSFGQTVVVDGVVQTTQKGIIRTNCMDCLDRTNVVQSAFAQFALEQALKNEGIDIDLQSDMTTSWFNTLWADNGDAISKQYSSTAALKGDYTRTRKRNYRGALNDLGLTLSRYYNNMVNDFFSQAVIDFLLGYVTTRVFEEFEEDMKSADPGTSLDKLRQNAIETSSKIAISEPSEDLIGGWAMLSPHDINTLRTLPFEESVILLTNEAVYSCRLDQDTQKLASFERVELRSIFKIHYGTYVTSILSDAQLDESRNIGLVIFYRAGKERIKRVNTRSLQSAVNEDGLFDKESLEKQADLKDWGPSLRAAKGASGSQMLAFKAITNRSSSAAPKHQKMNEIDTVKSICEEIERAVGTQKSDGEKPANFVEHTPLISQADARKRTGYLEVLGHELKRMVWG